MLALKNVDEIIQEIAKRVKERRLLLQLTQAGLAKRSGVSLGTLKRFELKGKISLESLVRVAFVLNCQSHFDELFKEETAYRSLDEALGSEKKRKRGSLN